MTPIFKNTSQETRRYLEIYDPEATMKIDLAYDGLKIAI